jgi:hypothetical protein
LHGALLHAGFVAGCCRIQHDCIESFKTLVKIVAKKIRTDSIF